MYIKHQLAKILYDAMQVRLIHITILWSHQKHLQHCWHKVK